MSQPVKYGKIGSLPDLEKLQAMAPEGTLAVGVSSAGSTYVFRNSVANEIKHDEAKALLGVDDETFRKIIETRGAYVIPEEVEEPEPSVEEELPVVDEPVITFTEIEPEDKVEDIQEVGPELEEDPVVEEEAKEPEEEMITIPLSEYNRLQSEVAAKETTDILYEEQSKELDELKSAISVFSKYLN